MIEQSVLQDVGFSNGDVICIDQVAPLESRFLGGNSLVWIKGLVPHTVGEDDIPPADVLVCLGASRYFTDAFDEYRKVVGRLRPGALVVIDFFNLPVIRRTAIAALREWVFTEWVRDRDSTMASLKDIARVSLSIGQGLAGSTVRIESSCPTLGLNSGIYATQRVLFEVFFPLSFKSGTDEEEMLAQIVWHLLCYSVEGNEERVLAFADSCAIDVIGVLALTPDTNVLVGRMASS